MELQDMASGVTGSSSAVCIANDNSEHYENFDHDVITTVSVNNDQTNQANVTTQHMDKMGSEVNDCGLVPEENADSFFYEEYEVADTMVSSTDNNEVYSFEVDQDTNSSFNIAQQTADHDYTTERDTFGDQADNEDVKSKEKFNVESLSYELQVGYRILSNMMSASNRCVNKLFLFPVDDNYPETSDYYEKIKEPMWMFKMKEKFESLQYKGLTDFMSDFRLMIENCYRFNGPDNFVSKRAQKLETMMKQKIALLSRDLREKILGNNSEDDILTSAGIRRRIKNPNMADDPSQQLLSQLRRDRVMQEKVDRKQKVEDRKAMEQARLQELQDWEDKLLGPEIKEKIRTMWELPQIGLFVYLCMESLGLEEEVTQYQLERGLALPRECSDFRRLMTCLLSTPHQRKSLKSFMPYHVWNTKLSAKIDYLYKVLADNNGNYIQACYKLGLDTRAYKMMGKSNPLLKKQFHELSFLKRVWILKNYCDFCMETQQYLQKTIDEIEAVRPMDVREVLLGSDGRGYRYINFPMFTGKDIRIFKHPKTPEPSLESLAMVDWSLEVDKPSASSSRCSTPVSQKNHKAGETPSTSLRARALLQAAAESKEASPLRDTRSDAVENTPQIPSSNSTDHSKGSAKVGSNKKRKRSSIFTGKRKRFKAGSRKSTVTPKPSDGCVENEEDCKGNGMDAAQNAANSLVDMLNKTSELNGSMQAEENNLTKEELQESSKSPSSSVDAAESARQVKLEMEEKGPFAGGVKDEPLKENKENLRSDENKPAVEGLTTSATLNSDIKSEVSKTEPKEESDDAKDVTTEDKKSVEVKQEVTDDAGSKESLSDESSSLEKVKSEGEVKEEAEDDETDEDDLPDVGHIELVAETMEDIRQLMNKLSNPEPIKRGKRTYPGVMKPCEEELLENITRFHEELLKYEKNLANARVSMQTKLRKEVESYVESKIDESKGWDSDHSQTSKDSSDDEEVTTKSDSDTVRQSKRIKIKQATPPTTALLSSAASKLSSITGEGNEDSNDSFELDISSRGRLRKRRVIPNNTEDTGIKKRKNIPNQESFFTNPLSPPASTVASTVSDQASDQTHNNNLTSDIISMLRSPQPNSAIKAQLSTPTGHILRLVAPSADGTIRTVRVSAKPNMVISSQSLSNLRFITSTGVVTFPRNTITTSSAQTSHPVIQQLLLNQSRSSAQTVTKTVNSSPRLAKPIQLQGIQTPVSGAVKLSHVITVPSPVSTLSSKMISPQSGSQAGVKQALDFGLSVTQIQQLIKNQAIQINTATGNPATLVLSGGLHSMANKQAPTSTASLTAAANSPVQMRMQASSSATPNQQIKIPATGVSSLLSVMNRAPSTQSQVLISTKNLTPLATISGQHLPQLIRPQSSTVVRVNTPLNTEVVNISKVVNNQNPVARFSDGSSFAGKVVSANAVVRQGIVRTVVSAGQKILPVPRIISSLNPLTSLRVSVPPNVNVAQAPLVSSTSQVTGGATLELAKARVINVPGMSPAKKYAGNVTVKALLENRGPKKQGEEDLEFEQASDLDACESTLVSSSDNDSSIFLANSNVQSHKLDTGLPLSSYSLASPTVSTFIPHTLPLSVDTGISSRNVAATSSEVIVPTVNIKVPSPNTLPSVLHNKNGTTIVQSTKVPIPVASEAKTGDSLSPVYQQSSSASTINALARVSNLSGAGEVTNMSNSTFKQVSSISAGQQLPSSVTTMKNVMLKVSPQTGGPGQFVQGYMTPRGLVIPQAALLQQQQGNNVIISGVSQAGNMAQIQPGQIHIQQSAVNVSGGQQSFSLSSRPTITQQLQQQPPQQILVNSSGSTGLYNPNPSLKVMFLNSTCGQSSLTTNSIISSVQQQPTNTPASELVKQLASNSHIQTHAQQSVAMSPSSNQQNSHILSNMIQGSNLQMSNATILPTQTIVNAGVSPQLAQIFTLQQGNQIQQQPNTVITTKPSTAQNKPSVVAVQLQQLGQILNLGGVSQVQLPQQQIASLQQLGSAGRVAQPNQVLQLAINPQAGGQTLVAATPGPQIVRVATQLSPQIQNQGLSSLQPQGNIIIQQQQGQNIVLQQQSMVGNSSSQQFSALQVSKAPTLATTNIQTSVVGQAQNTSSLVLSQLQSPVVSTPASINQFQYVYNPSTAAQPGFTVVPSPHNRLSVGSVAGTVNRIIRADSSSTLTMLPSQGNVIGNTVRHASALNNKGGISQMIIPNSANGQFLISPVKLATQAQQSNIISPIKYIQNPNSVSGQASNQFLINSALSSLPAQVSVKPSVIYANQVSADKKEGKVAQILLSRPAPPSLNTSHQAGSGISVSVAAAPVTAKLSGGETGAKTILYKIGDQYFSPAGNLSGLQQGASQTTNTANLTPVASNSKMDVQLLVPPACIEASDQILKHNNTVSPANTIPSTVTMGASACQNLVQNRSVGAVRNPEQAVSSVNGVHQGNAQFSFSLSGPATLNNKSSLRPDGLLMLNGQMPFAASGQTSGNSQEATSAPPVQLGSSVGQYSGGDRSYQKVQPGQRLSNNEISLQEQNEKEAALNLLTFANQPI